jgi:hypothetical protein
MGIFSVKPYFIAPFNMIFQYIKLYCWHYFLSLLLLIEFSQSDVEVKSKGFGMGRKGNTA